MTTTPIVPVIATTPPLTPFQKVSHYLLKHEKLALFLFVGLLSAALIWGVTGKYESYKLAHDQNAYNAQLAQLKETSDKNAQQAAINAQQAQANAALAEQYRQAAASAQAANAQLEQATAALLVAVKQAKVNDAKLPTPELGTRIATLAKVPPTTITANKDDSLTIAHDGAVGIAQALEDLPVLTAQIGNLQTEKANLNGQITAQDKLVAGLNTQVAGQLTQIDGLNLQITQAGGVCQAQIKVIKDTAAKGKRKWFIIGYVAGLSTRGIIKIFAGV